jgi:GrpB-like predicted nucleotidyltransferase (UPF0157 family)
MPRSAQGLDIAILNAMSEQPQPEYLQPPVRADGPIRLADPDPDWAAQYAREQERISAALGSRAVLVEHVGSTSVLGIAAKPVIDIVLTVIDSSDEAGYLPDLEAAGYVLQFREPDWYEHRLLRDHDPDVQVHVFTVGSSEVERMCCFSATGCAADPKSVRRMNAPRVSLLPDGGTTFQDYADAKSAVIEEIISRAQGAEKQ